MQLWNLFVLLIPSLAGAAIHIDAYIPDLFARSDVVCRGTVLSDTIPNLGALDASGHLLPNEHLAVIKVQSCYKGAVAGGELRLSLPQVNPMSGAPLPAGLTLVVFAKAGTQGGYLPTDSGEPTFFWNLPGGKTSGETGLALIEEELSQVATTAGQGSSLRSMQLLLRFRSLHERTLLALQDQPPPTNPDLAVIRILLLVCRL